MCNYIEEHSVLRNYSDVKTYRAVSTTTTILAEVAEQVEYVERLFSSCASYIN